MFLQLKTYVKEAEYIEDSLEEIVGEGQGTGGSKVVVAVGGLE